MALAPLSYMATKYKALKSKSSLLSKDMLVSYRKSSYTILSKGYVYGFQKDAEKTRRTETSVAAEKHRKSIPRQQIAWHGNSPW
jgi:hypothetical protein